MLQFINQNHDKENNILTKLYKISNRRIFLIYLKSYLALIYLQNLYKNAAYL
jgi:hypothetical protein